MKNMLVQVLLAPLTPVLVLRKISRSSSELLLLSVKNILRVALCHAALLRVQIRLMRDSLAVRPFCSS